MATPLEHQTFGTLLDAIAAKSPTPGGGAVAGAIGALGSALAQMVVNYTIGKKRFAAYEDELQDALAQLQRARDAMLELAEEDAAAYALVSELSALPEDDDRRVAEYGNAIRLATNTPLATAGAGVAMLRLLSSLAPKTNPYLKSDLLIAALLADATVHAAAHNVRINVPTLRSAVGDEEADTVERRLEQLLSDAATIRASIA